MGMVLALWAAAPAARAQDAAQPAVAAPAETPADTAFTREELRKLLAPYALFPDALLAQLLPASAYPIEIVQASRWLSKNKAAIAKKDFSGIDAQAWDPSVKALARFPDLVEKLNADLDATTDLGDAFVNQPDEVALVIQDLRREAQKAGSLKTTKQQRVTSQKQGTSQTEYIVIEPTDPQVIYVPAYDPMLVYDESYVTGSNVASGLIGFGLGVAVGVAVDNVWDWGRGWVYPPRWPGYPGYRPGWNGNNNINIDRDVNIGNGNTIVGGGNTIGGGNTGNGNTRPWRPDGDRYRPGQGSKPGLANPDRRPGGGTANRPSAPGNLNRPTTLPAVQPGSRPNAGGAGQRPETRPAIQNPKLPDTRDVKRPEAKRPEAKRPEGKRPEVKNPGAVRPATRPAPPRDTAFGDARLGGASKQFEQRGAASRQAVQRPASAPRPDFNRGGGGGRPQMGGGGGRPQMGGGGGGRQQIQRGGGGGRGGRGR